MTERGEYCARILRALDLSLQEAARARGIAACDGLDDSQPCDIGHLHTRAGELASAIADAIDDPDKALRSIDALQDFVLALQLAWDGHPRLS